MAKETIIIIDYGSGNIRSAAKAFEHVVTNDHLEAEVKISDKAEDILTASRIVLPGQGAFGDCMKGLQNAPGIIEALEESVLKKGTPFFGICVGMQLMVTEGHEHGVHKGLDWIPGQVVPMTPSDKSLKIPHMGWNDVTLTPEGTDHFVLRSTESSDKKGQNYYFVHSFMVESKDKRHSLAQSDYGGPITAVIGRDNMLGVQFHPEKSQETGLRLISGFLNWKP